MEKKTALVKTRNCGGNRGHGLYSLQVRKNSRRWKRTSKWAAVNFTRRYGGKRGQGTRGKSLKGKMWLDTLKINAISPGKRKGSLRDAEIEVSNKKVLREGERKRRRREDPGNGGGKGQNYCFLHSRATMKEGNVNTKKRTQKNYPYINIPYRESQTGLDFIKLTRLGKTVPPRNRGGEERCEGVLRMPGWRMR